MDFTWKTSHTGNGDVELAQAVDSLWELWDDPGNGGRAFRILECLVLQACEPEDEQSPGFNVLKISLGAEDGIVNFRDNIKVGLGQACGLDWQCRVWHRFVARYSTGPEVKEMKAKLQTILAFAQEKAAFYDAQFDGRPMLTQRLKNELKKSKVYTRDDYVAMSLPELYAKAQDWGVRLDIPRDQERLDELVRDIREHYDKMPLPELYKLAQKWCVKLDIPREQFFLDQLMQNANNPICVGPDMTAEEFIKDGGGEAYRAPLVEKLLGRDIHPNIDDGEAYRALLVEKLLGRDIHPNINDWAKSMDYGEDVDYIPVAHIMLIWCECKLYEQMLGQTREVVDDFLRVMEPITRGAAPARVVGYKSFVQRKELAHPDDALYGGDQAKSFDGLKRTISVNRDMQMQKSKQNLQKIIKDNNKCNPCHPQALFSRMRNLFVTGLLGNYQLVCLFDSFFWTRQPFLEDPILRLGKVDKATRIAVEDEHKNRTQFQNMGGFLNHHARFDESVQAMVWRAVASDVLRGIPFPMTELSRLRKDGFSSCPMNTFGRMFFDFDIVCARRMSNTIAEEDDQAYRAATAENIARICQGAMRKSMVSTMTHSHVVDDELLLAEIKGMGKILGDRDDTHWFAILEGEQSSDLIFDFDRHDDYIQRLQQHWERCLETLMPLKIKNEFQNLARKLENIMRQTIVQRLLLCTVSTSPHRLVTPLKTLFANACDVSESIADLYLTRNGNDLDAALTDFNKRHSIQADTDGYNEWSLQSFHNKIEACTEGSIELKASTFKAPSLTWKNSFHIVFPFLPTTIHDQVMLADICKESIVSDRKLRAVFSESELNSMVDCAVYTGRPKLRPNFSLKLAQGGCRRPSGHDGDSCCDLQKKKHNNNLVCTNCLVTPAAKNKGTDRYRNWFTFAALIDSTGSVQLRRRLNRNALLKNDVYFLSHESAVSCLEIEVPAFMNEHWDVENWRQQTVDDANNAVCAHRLNLIILGNGTELDRRTLTLDNTPMEALARELQLCSIHGFPDSVVCCADFDDTQNYHLLRSVREAGTDQVNLWDSEAKTDFGGRHRKLSNKTSGVQGEQNIVWAGFDSVMAGTNCVAQTLDSLLLPEIRFLLVFIMRDAQLKGWSQHCFEGDKAAAADFGIDMDADEYPFRRLLPTDQQQEEQRWARAELQRAMKALTDAKNRPQLKRSSSTFLHQEIIMASEPSQHCFDDWPLSPHLLHAVQQIFGGDPEEATRRVHGRLSALSQYYGPRFSGEMSLIGHATIKKVTLHTSGMNSSMDVYFHNSEKFTPCPHLCQGGVIRRDVRMSMARGAPQSHLTNTELMQQNTGSGRIGRCFDRRYGGYHRSEWNRSYVRIFLKRQNNPKDAIVQSGLCCESVQLGNTLRAALRCPAQHISKHEQFLYSSLQRNFAIKPCSECGSGGAMAHYPCDSMSFRIPDHVLSEALRGVIFPSFFDKNGVLIKVQKIKKTNKNQKTESVPPKATKRPPIESTESYAVEDPEKMKHLLFSQQVQILRPKKRSKMHMLGKLCD
jgi:hypothetical protein